jgi:hypothetical protein
MIDLTQSLRRKRLSGPGSSSDTLSGNRILPEGVNEAECDFCSSVVRIENIGDAVRG